MKSATRTNQGEDERCFHIDSGKQAIAALGVDLKNSLCLLQNDLAHTYPVNGDINDPAIYLQVANALDQINDIQAVACDLHPDLQSTRLAEKLAGRLDVPVIRVQHHHAHIAAVIAEHEIEEPVIGLAMDGYGYGSDGSAWGGECLFVEGGDCTRVGCIKPVAMPGSDAASRQPWRMAVAWLGEHEALPRWFDGVPVEAVQQLSHSAHTPLTSSAGRLFDAASAIVLGSREVSFEGEAAIALERAATEAKDFKRLSYQLSEVDGLYQLDCREALEQLVDGVEVGVEAEEAKSELAAAFHHMLAEGMAEMATRMAGDRGVKAVALAGGCFLNRLLKGQITARLEAAGLRVLMSEQVPQGDGAIALGQAWVAAQYMKRGDD